MLLVDKIEHCTVQMPSASFKSNEIDYSYACITIATNVFTLAVSYTYILNTFRVSTLLSDIKIYPRIIDDNE